MTQNPYAQQVPQQPQPGPYGDPNAQWNPMAQQQPAPQYQPQQYAQPPQPYGGPQYAPGTPQGGYYAGQPYPQQQPPAPQLADGSLSAFSGQPSGSAGKAISWAGCPVGHTVTGTVRRDVTDGDVQQETDFDTRAPLFYRDNRPRFQLIVPLWCEPTQEVPDGEFALYVKGQLREVFTAAYQRHGLDAPKEGDTVEVTLTEKRPSRRPGAKPRNIFSVQYLPAGGGEASQPSAPASQAQPEPQQQADQWAPAGTVNDQFLAQPQQPTPQPQQASAPAPAAPAPGGMSEAQAALFAQLQAQQAGGKA